MKYHAYFFWRLKNDDTKFGVCCMLDWRLKGKIVCLCPVEFGYFCLFDLILYVPANKISVMLGPVSLG